MQRIIDIKNGVTRMPEWRMAQPVNFELLDGENIAITGPNGGGKSMFVDIITGKHPLLGDSIKYDFAPSTKEYISDNIKYVCFKDTYGGDNDSTYYLQQIGELFACLLVESYVRIVDDEQSGLREY